MNDSWIEPSVQFEARNKSLDSSFSIFQFSFKRTQLTYIPAIDSIADWIMRVSIYFWEKLFKKFQTSRDVKVHYFLNLGFNR